MRSLLSAWNAISAIANRMRSFAKPQFALGAELSTKMRSTEFSV